MIAEPPGHFEALPSRGRGRVLERREGRRFEELADPPALEVEPEFGVAGVDQRHAIEQRAAVRQRRREPVAATNRLQERVQIARGGHLQRDRPAIRLEAVETGRLANHVQRLT